jgi:hypothetical protein
MANGESVCQKCSIINSKGYHIIHVENHIDANSIEFITVFSKNSANNELVISIGGPKSNYVQFFQEIYASGISYNDVIQANIENKFVSSYINYYRNAIKSILGSKHSYNKIVFVGHSFGGSIAMLAAYDTHKNSFINQSAKQTFVYTYGALHIGDSQFISSLHAVIGRPVYRITNTWDIYTQIPRCIFSRFTKNFYCYGTIKSLVARLPMFGNYYYYYNNPYERIKLTKAIPLIETYAAHNVGMQINYQTVFKTSKTVVTTSQKKNTRTEKKKEFKKNEANKIKSLPLTPINIAGLKPVNLEYNEKLKRSISKTQLNSANKINNLPSNFPNQNNIHPLITEVANQKRFNPAVKNTQKHLHNIVNQSMSPLKKINNHIPNAAMNHKLTPAITNKKINQHSSHNKTNINNLEPDHIKKNKKKKKNQAQNEEENNLNQENPSSFLELSVESPKIHFKRFLEKHCQNDENYSICPYDTAVHQVFFGVNIELCN